MDKVAHHYLHEQAFGTTIAKREDANTVICGLGKYDYSLSINERDQRALIVFDGELLYGGLPKNAAVLDSFHLPDIYLPSAVMRKNPEYPCEAWPHYVRDDDDDPETAICIYRHFLLLPSCTAIVRKFRNKSLSPIYTIIRTFVNEKGTRAVEWQTTSY
jgi:hypothetical protein